MKLNELKSIIRSTIKTEVRNAIREELTDIMLGREMQNTPAKLSSVVPNKQKIAKPTTQQAGVKYSNNPQLNEILNQTVGFNGGGGAGLPQEQEDTQTVGFDSTDARSGNLRGRFSQLMGLDDGPGGIQSLDNNLNQTAAELGTTAEALPSEVQNMMTKDYTAVLKKIEEKKGKA